MRFRLVVAIFLTLHASIVIAFEPRVAAPVPAEAAFENMRTNAPVSWLIRMVAYDPADPKLRVDHLSKLGAPSEDFTFVADLAEVEGYLVTEAIRKAGGMLPEGHDVSAVLFPIHNHTIFPASVRGMLQVVQQIDMRRAAEPGYRTAPLDILLTDSERANLAAVDLASWAWQNYRHHYPAFARAFVKLRDQKASAIGRIGHIGSDWCPPGCARILHPRSEAEKNAMTLSLPGGEAVTIENFGVRVFLIRNLPIGELHGRELLDFDDPHSQRIPSIDERL